MLKYKIVKVLRVIIASITLVLFSAIFLLPEHSLGDATYFQMMPASIRGMTTTGIFAISAFLVLLLLTYLFGRIYCSFICPLGIAQDIVIRLRSLLKQKKDRNLSFNHRRLRYSVLAFTVAALSAGVAIPLGLLEPFAIFGRFVSAIIKPIYIFINNKIVNMDWLESLYPLDYNPFSFALFTTASITFLVILSAAILKGRFFCNTLCPVGTLLGLLSKIAWFKMEFNSDLCIKCGKCALVCKSNCIDYKNYTVDHERCVSCFNCISVCSEGAMNYIHSNTAAIEPVTDLSKRDFFAIGASAAAGAAIIPSLLRPSGGMKTAVMPPGADNFNHFTSKCTACQLCISNCPSSVLKPASLQYGLSGFLQPRLDFDSGMCEFSCTACSNICPNGALKPITEEKKRYLQIGIVNFAKERCVVVTEKTYCGACGEHCPTGAIQMVELPSGLTLPDVNQAVCIGCGACEYICPASPQKAMIVSGLKKHGTAIEVEETEQAIDHLKGKDFPF